MTHAASEEDASDYFATGELSMQVGTTCWHVPCTHMQRCALWLLHVGLQATTPGSITTTASPSGRHERWLHATVILG
jgi:hypothetical protein